MLVSAVPERLDIERGFGVFELNDDGCTLASTSFGKGHGNFECSQGLATVAADSSDKVIDGLVASCCFFDVEASAQQLLDCLVAERLKPEECGPGKQWRIDLEVRVLGRSSDQHDEAALDSG